MRKLALFSVVVLFCGAVLISRQTDSVRGSAAASAESIEPTALQTACTAPPGSMTRWYPGDGNANDILNGNNGTPQNGAGFASGKVLQAFSLDCVNDYVGIVGSLVEIGGLPRALPARTQQ